MTQSIPLDLAGQVIWAAWSLEKCPSSDRRPVETVLQRSLTLGGVNDVQQLKVRKLQHLPVFGQLRAYPQGSRKDALKLIKQIRDITLADIAEPSGKPLAVGPAWDGDTTITVEKLMSDVWTQRNAQSQLKWQLEALAEGIELDFNPIERTRLSETYTCIEGDTLQSISVRLYGKVDYWRGIARINAIDYPYIVLPGQILSLPEVNNG